MGESPTAGDETDAELLQPRFGLECQAAYSSTSAQALCLFEGARG